MQDLNQSTDKVSPGDSNDVAHSILLQLDPQDPTTVPTILTCQLVSRSFNAAAQSASVWRPLLQRWTTGEPEYTKLPIASDQSLMDLAIDPLDPPIHPRAVFRARTRVDRIALAAAARRGDSVEKQGRIESYDTIAMLGTQVYDAIIRIKTVSREERHDYLAIRRVAHELEPPLTRGISMELWRNAFDDQKSKGVTIDAMSKSLAPFGTPWKTFDAIDSDLQRLADHCHQRIRNAHAAITAKGEDIALPHLVASGVWVTLSRLGYKVLPSSEVTQDSSYPYASCHLSALLDVESFRQLEASNPPERLIPEITASFLVAGVVERLPGPFTMKSRLQMGKTLAVAEKNEPAGHEHWFLCNLQQGGTKDLIELDRELVGEPEETRRWALDPSPPRAVCAEMAKALLKSVDVDEDGVQRTCLLAHTIFELVALAAHPGYSTRHPDPSNGRAPKFPTDIPIDSILAVHLYGYPNDAFIFRKHFHALLSVPAHLDEFDASFEEVLPTREIGGIPFDSDQTVAIDPEVKSLLAFKVGEACIICSGGNEEFGVVVGWFIDEFEEDGLRVADASLEEQKSQLRYRILTKTSGHIMSADELCRIKPSEKRRWQRARKVIESRTILGEWFSSRSDLEYPTYIKTEAWAAVYPED
ncbi:hypothetical protein RQP46_003265 [Phenoliferia psychrophenolica]